jgi:hypothetical protein
MIIDDECPKTEEYYYGRCAHGFDTEQEAWNYIPLLRANIPGVSYAIFEETEDDPFDGGPKPLN